MALVFDNRHNLQGEPGFHALIAGVSFYRHLPGGGGEPAKKNWNLPQLSATALTALKIYSWLIKRRQQLPRKLATVRLLLSPSSAEKPEIDKGMQEVRNILAQAGDGAILQDIASPCNLLNFTAEARHWKEDTGANNDENNVAFFYFSGHGIQRKSNDPVLLLEDFGNPEAGLLANSVAFNALFDGMVPPAADSNKKLARTQFYFVDACRVIPPELQQLTFPNISDILNDDLPGVDNRSAPIFYATVSNTKAYAKNGKQTLFSEALIECLEGYGGDGEEDASGDKWSVSSSSLSAALNAKVASLKALGIDQEFYPTQRGQNTAIVNLNGPPQVDCVLEIQPDKAARRVTVKLTDPLNAQNPIWNLSPVEPHPYRKPLAAGFYALEARITSPPDPPYVDAPTRIVRIRPVTGDWLKVKVVP